MSLVDRNRHHPRCDAGSPCPGITVAEMHLSCRAHPGNRPEDVSSSRPRSPWERGTHREHRRAESVSTCPKAPGSPHTSPTTGAIAEELGWTPQSSLGVAQLHAKHTNAYSLLPPLDTKAKPVSPSQRTISTSRTPRLASSAQTPAQNLAPSWVWIQILKPRVQHRPCPRLRRCGQPC